MFKAIIAADKLSAAIGALTPLLDECKLHLNEDGIEVRGVEAANVGMVDVSLDADGFESYDADGGVIGVNLERLEKVIGFADSGDLVHLELDEETRKLHIEIDGLEYTLALIDPDSIRQEPDIPDLDLPGTYVFEGKRFDRAVTAADLVSDHIAIEGRADAELGFEAEGDTDDVEVTLEDRDLLSGRLDDDGPVRSLFSLDYLQDMTKPIGGDTEVSMLVGDEFPIKLRFSRADGAVKVVYMLAPRIQSD